MTKVWPFIRCVDYWPGAIPPAKLRAYKRLIETGTIVKQNVIYNRSTGSVTVEYFANAPHEWIRAELKKEAKA